MHLGNEKILHLTDGARSIGVEREFTGDRELQRQGYVIHDGPAPQTLVWKSGYGTPTRAQLIAMGRTPPPKRTIEEYRAFYKDRGYHSEHADQMARDSMTFQQAYGYGAPLQNLPYCETLPADERNPFFNCVKRPEKRSEKLTDFALTVAAGVGLAYAAGAFLGAPAAETAASVTTAKAAGATATQATAAGTIAAEKAALAAAGGKAAGAAATAKTAAAVATGGKAAGIVATAAPAIAKGAGTAAGIVKGAGAAAGVAAAADAVSGGMRVARGAGALLNTAATVNAIRNGTLPPPPLNVNDPNLGEWAGTIANWTLQQRGIDADEETRRALEQEILRQQQELSRAVNNAGAGRSPGFISPIISGIAEPINEFFGSDNAALYVAGGFGLILLIALTAPATRTVYRARRRKAK